LGNASGRGPTISTPLAALRDEIVRRYLYNFGMAPWNSLSGRVNVIPLILLLAGVAACLAIGDLRRHRGFRLILVWTAITAFYLPFFEGLHPRFYLIYITPLYCVLCAVAAYWFWTRRPRSRLAIAALAAILILSQAARSVIIAWRNPKASD